MRGAKDGMTAKMAAPHHSTGVPRMANDYSKPVTPRGFGRVWREGLDRMFLGNRGYDYRTGMWNRPGVISGVVQNGVNTVLGPLGSAGYGIWANIDRRRGGDGIPFANVAGNPNGVRTGENYRSTAPGSGFTGVSGPGGVGGMPSGGVGALGGLAGYVARIGGGITSSLPQGGSQVPGGPMQISPTELRLEGDFRYTPQQIGSGPIRTINGPIMAPTNMGGARSMFNSGGTSITDPEAIARQMGMIPQAAWNPRAGYGDLQN